MNAGKNLRQAARKMHNVSNDLLHFTTVMHVEAMSTTLGSEYGQSTVFKLRSDDWMAVGYLPPDIKARDRCNASRHSHGPPRLESSLKPFLTFRGFRYTSNVGRGFLLVYVASRLHLFSTRL